MIYICCYNKVIHYFIHIIDCILYELNLLNKSCSFSSNLDEFLLFSNKTIILFGGHNILYNSNFSSFLKNNNVYIFNTEQLQSQKWNYFIEGVKNDIAGWIDYSNLNLRYLKQFGLSKDKRVKHIYFGYSKCLSLIKDNSNLNKTNIIFYGCHHDRRKQICDKLNVKLKEKGLNLNVIYDTSNSIVGDKYNNVINENMIYLNIHYYIPSILEIVRIVPLLSNGHLVITERSDDKEMDELFSPYVVWLDDVINNIEYLNEIINKHDNKKLQKAFSENVKFNIKNLVEEFNL
jgi:hypothetical protein